MDRPTFIHLFIHLFHFVATFILWWFIWASGFYVHPHLAHLFITFALHHIGEQSLIMLSRQLCSLGLAMSMHALLCSQFHLTLNGLGERLIMFLLGFTNSVLGFISFYYTVRGLCLVSLETVGECSRLLLTIQCFMYYGCFNHVMCHSICENRRTVKPKATITRCDLSP